MKRCGVVAHVRGMRVVCACPGYAHTRCAPISGCLRMRACVRAAHGVRGRGGDSAWPARKDAHTHRHAPGHAAQMMADLALLARPPQEPLSQQQSAEQPAGGGRQRAVEPEVRTGGGGGWSQRENGKGLGGTYACTHSRTHTGTRKQTHSRTHALTCTHTYVRAWRARPAVLSHALARRARPAWCLTHTQGTRMHTYELICVCVCIRERGYKCLLVLLANIQYARARAHTHTHTHTLSMLPGRK